MGRLRRTGLVAMAESAPARMGWPLEGNGRRAASGAPRGRGRPGTRARRGGRGGSIPLLAVFLAVLLGAQPGLGAPRPIRETVLQAAFQGWDLSAMRRELVGGPSGRDDVLWWGVLKLLEGDLPSADHFLSRSRDPLARSLLPVVRGSREVAAGLVEAMSPGQRIRVIHPPGTAEALLPYLFEAGDAALDLFLDRLGVREDPGEALSVWLVPSFQDMARVTGLERSQLDAAGAVAVCDLRRVVMVTPDALPWGYPYADTLAHEIVHYLLTIRGGGRVPIWFQEGVAKAWERSWRGRPVGEVGRTAARLLDTATLQRRWIPLDRIEKGLLSLGSSDAVQLAFAELAAFMAWTTARKGDDAVARLVEEMRGGDAEIAFLRVVGARPGEWFLAFLRERENRAPEVPDPRPGMVMREGTGESLPALAPEVEARVRLADRLAGNQRFLSAATLLREVLAAMPVPHPEVVGRLARVLRQGGRPEEALAVLDQVALDEEEFPWLARERGLALVGAGRLPEAVDPLLVFVRTDPWEGEAHRALAEAFRSVGHRDLAEREDRLRERGR